MDHSIALAELAVITILGSYIAYSLFSRKLNQTVFTLPIIFTVIGFTLADPVSALGTPEQLDETRRILAEVTLVLVLFSDASHVRFARLHESYKLPLRMLVIGLPLTVLLGTGVIYALAPEGGWALALLAAAILTPTDAALGQSVLTNPKIPEHLSQTISVESGLNDGLALPFVTLGALLVSGGMDHTGGLSLAGTALQQVLLAPLIGGAVGWIVARLLSWSIDRNLIELPAQGVVFLCTAFACYLTSVAAGGNGFIAAFVGGMVFGNAFRHDAAFISEFMESEGQLLTMSAFMVFGALMVPDALEMFNWRSVVMALCMLTFVRMLPIWISLSGTVLSAPEKLFLGWFGPRGLASLLFTLLVLEQITLAQESELLSAVTLTVLMSVFLHGLTAIPLGNRIAGRAH